MRVADRKEVQSYLEVSKIITILSMKKSCPSLYLSFSLSLQGAQYSQKLFGSENLFYFKCAIRVLQQKCHFLANEKNVKPLHEISRNYEVVYLYKKAHRTVKMYSISHEKYTFQAKTLWQFLETYASVKPNKAKNFIY